MKIIHLKVVMRIIIDVANVNDDKILGEIFPKHEKDAIIFLGMAHL